MAYDAILIRAYSAYNWLEEKVKSIKRCFFDKVVKKQLLFEYLFFKNSWFIFWLLILS